MFEFSVHVSQACNVIVRYDAKVRLPVTYSRQTNQNEA